MNSLKKLFLWLNNWFDNKGDRAKILDLDYRIQYLSEKFTHTYPAEDQLKIIREISGCFKEKSEISQRIMERKPQRQQQVVVE